MGRETDGGRGREGDTHIEASYFHILTFRCSAELDCGIFTNCLSIQQAGRQGGQKNGAHAPEYLFLVFALALYYPRVVASFPSSARCLTSVSRWETVLFIVTRITPVFCARLLIDGLFCFRFLLGWRQSIGCTFIYDEEIASFAIVVHPLAFQQHWRKWPQTQ